MKSLSSVGLGLSLVFGCLFLALVAEVYYLLWWKKRVTTTNLEDGYSTRTCTATEIFYMFGWKKKPPSTPPTLRPLKLSPQQFCTTHEILVHDPQAQTQGNSSKDLWIQNQMPSGETDSVEAELMRLQSFSGGPPRFLFTIKEETKEDLESEDGKSRDSSRKGSRSRSLSDLFHVVETPYFTPIASPPYYTPPLTPVKASLHNQQHGFNSFFGSASEAEFNWFLSSPPPMFKFLRDAEDKLCRRKWREENNDDEEHFHKFDVPSTSKFLKDEEVGSFITLVVNKTKQEELIDDDHPQIENVLQFPSNSSRVLPLASSPVQLLHA